MSRMSAPQCIPSVSYTHLKALIVMPVATADIKVDAVRNFGGEVDVYKRQFSLLLANHITQIR